MQGFRDAGSKMPNVRCKDDETCGIKRICDGNPKNFSLVVGGPSSVLLCSNYWLLTSVLVPVLRGPWLFLVWSVLRGPWSVSLTP